MRRVRKEEIQKPPSTPDPVGECLACWKAWMGCADRDLGVKAAALLQCDRDGYEDGHLDPEIAEAKRTNEIGGATGAMIDGLPRHLKFALYVANDVTRVDAFFRVLNYPNLDLIAANLEARTELEKKLRVGLATWHLF